MATRIMTSSDLINNVIPKTLGGVSVEINGKAAYVYYVSPGQINVLSPADTSTGSVAVTVTNAAGTSKSVSAAMQTLLPGLFVLANYVRAVRALDRTIINGTGASEGAYLSAAAANPGDKLELFGTGFGSTSPSVDVGPVFTGGYPTTNTVTVSIDGIDAPVSFAGLVGPGLYQINITIPSGLSPGDHPVIASAGGVAATGEALLKTA